MTELVALRSRNRFPQPSRMSTFMALGFRPFFLLATGFGALVVPAWLAMLSGQPILPISDGMFWHVHEMVFGYSTAVVAGFLLTAVRNWTQRSTPHGLILGALALLWLLGRGTMTTGWTGAAAAVNLTFLPALAVGIGAPLFAARSQRNYKILAIVVVLWLLQGVMFADALGVSIVGGLAIRAVQAGLGALVVLCLIVAGRIVPMFTSNATRIDAIRSHPYLDRVSIGLASVHFALSFAAVWPVAAAIAGIVAGIATLARMVHWGSRHTLRTPLLWILHLGHGLIGLGLGASGLRSLGGVWPEFSATITYQAISASHALGVGGVGVLTLGMMARVALGHTGRPLIASRAANLSIILIAIAAIVRICAPVLGFVGQYSTAVQIAGVLWTASMVVYVGAYWRILTTPRADGKPD